MKIVQKGNKQLRVTDEHLNEMLNRGFVQVDEKTGKVIQQKKADDVATLKKENAALKKANDELQAQVAALKKAAEEAAQKAAKE